MPVDPAYRFVRVALDVPVGDGFDYALDPDHAADVRPGSWVLVPWGRGRRIGIVTDLLADTDVPPDRLRTVLAPVADAPVLDAGWLTLVRFAARYYHRSVGEVALPAIPKLLRTPPAPKARGSAFTRARKRGPGVAPTTLETARPGADAPIDADAGAESHARPAALPPVLNEAQAQALSALRACEGFAVHLLHGITGSGKTEVYLHWLDGVLAARPGAQALLLVPEIALTPQLFGQIAARFPGETLALLHSDLPDAERAAHWLAAAEGRARLVVGTRLSVLAPLPRLAAIVVDEEHDASYKQQEGVHYSARDLAIALGAQRGIPVVLGSATPSLESWLAVKRGRYRLLALPQRAGAGAMPGLRVLDPKGRAVRQGLLPEAVEAIGATVARGEQALVFINRRGYAPVLGCEACGWLSRCDGCTAYRVLHRLDGAAPPGRSRYRLVCHHCGEDAPVPRACPDCGNVDLTPVGRGTQRLEEGLQALFPAARVARVDRDVARRRNAARDVIDAAHAGDVDILVGTQMLAKGHDFRRLTLVVVVDADGGLYSSDFRAPERLFAVLMQVAGRAGRSGARSEVIVQTRFPGHPIFAALARHDYAVFADAQLAERRQAGLPPFVFQALLRAQARTPEAALGFLASARALADPPADVTVYDPVPMPMARLAGQERAQLLVESASRPALHAFVDGWLARIEGIRVAVRWQLEIDPLEI